MELHSNLCKIFPKIPSNTVHGALWTITIDPPKGVYKPTRGLYKYSTDDTKEIDEPLTPVRSTTLREELFYEPFSTWLVGELGECNEAVSFGGSVMGKKWGTPDVIGIYRPAVRDQIKFLPEIVSAEIKTDPSYPVTAFGQAIAYRLFSSKTYLVEPNNMLKEDRDRIEALCMLFGVGLVYFKPDPKDPDFEIRVRAQRFIPDMFFVNEFLRQLDKVKPELFNKLFP